MILKGKVISKVVAKNSKSERKTLLLECEDGKQFILRRKGEPSFGIDEKLKSLIGKLIKVNGVKNGSTLIIDSWEIV